VKSVFRTPFAALFAVVFLAGCATSGGPIGDDPSIAVADLTALPAPGVSGFSQGRDTEVVRSLDVLSVAVFGVDELSRDKVRVGLNGSFEYPLIGTVQADGRELTDIADEMETRMAGSIVRNPDVQVSFVAREGQVFTIGGEIEAPGQYPINRPVTLMEAVAIGRGRTEYARMQEILVFRNVADQRYIGVYDLGAIQRGNYPDPQIYPEDIIMVGESPMLRNLARLGQLAPLITNPLILISRVAR